ncbi:hypothetical protein AOZ06_41820 [Kibdelosporangium phytohabitans]|uniref:DinB-like domain-containing protein n=1 Tax=Kibdelosporangium phytohabitans TaxID=860235 RepID=A0A0N9IJZ7_9PSEU|nr:hypothetical protein AOZ06_41820 [Kibdelosporangium phytohabitans]
MRAGADDFAVVLRSAADVRRRPGDGVWSPLEYSSHVRDVLLSQRERVLLAQRVDTPDCVPMGVDDRVEREGYNEQEPEAVARQITDAALLLATVLDRLDDAGWQRRLIYNYPASAERSVRWVAMHALHEVRHHLMDVRRQLA